MRVKDTEKGRDRAWRMEVGLQSKVHAQAPNQLQCGWRPAPRRMGRAWPTCSHCKALPEPLSMEAGTSGHSALRRRQEQERVPWLPKRKRGDHQPKTWLGCPVIRLTRK